MLHFTYFVLALLKSDCVIGEQFSRSGIYMDNNQGQTAPLGDVPWENARLIQKEFLNLLKLEHVPQLSGHHTNSNKHNSVPEFMKDIYRTVEDSDSLIDSVERVGGLHLLKSELRRRHNVSYFMEKNIYDADLILSVPNSEHTLHMRHKSENHIFFRLDNLPIEESFTNAEVRLYRDPWHGQNEAILLTLHLLNSGPEGNLWFSSNWTQRLLRPDDVGWFDINISNWVRQWIESRTSNVGIFLSFRRLKGSEITAFTSGIELQMGEAYSPFLVAFFKSRKASRTLSNRWHKVYQRTRRSVSNAYAWGNNNYAAYYHKQYEKKYGGNRKCARRHFHVYFKDLNWDTWMIAPPHYEAYFCYGECAFPLDANANVTNHAIVQTLMHVNRPTRVPATCCVPVRLKPLNMLYTADDNEVMLRKYNNMIVESCGCR